MEFSDKTVLITGASSGLGEALVQRFLAEGAKVFGVGRRERVELTHPNYYYFSGDLTHEDEAGRAVECCCRVYGGLDCLINCAGVTGIGNVFQTDGAEFRHQFEVNVFAMYDMVRAALPELSKRHGSTIINIGSELGSKAKAERIAYCPSKAAVEMLTKCLAIECGPGIRVNGVLPGLMDTPMTHARFASMPDPEAARREAGSRYILKRLCRVEDVVEAVLFLAGERSSFITGDMIAVCGGGHFTTCFE